MITEIKNNHIKNFMEFALNSRQHCCKEFCFLKPEISILRHVTRYMYVSYLFSVKDLRENGKRKCNVPKTQRCLKPMLLLIVNIELKI